QVRHNFPTLEDLENVRREGKNVVFPPLAFVQQQILAMHPILLPLWLAGAIAFLWDRRYRVLGLTFLVFFTIMEVSHAKDYYLFPIYPMLFAAGAVALERWTAARAVGWRVAVTATVAAAGLATLPLATWMLPPEQYIAYEAALGFKHAKEEVGHE